jgi:hypothetical protein
MFKDQIFTFFQSHSESKSVTPQNEMAERCREWSMRYESEKMEEKGK